MLHLLSTFTTATMFSLVHWKFSAGCRGGDAEDVRGAGLFWRTPSTRPRHLVACKCHSPGQIRSFVIQSFARSISPFRKRSESHSVAPSRVPSERKRDSTAKASKQSLSVCVSTFLFTAPHHAELLCLKRLRNHLFFHSTPVQGSNSST